MSTEPPAVQDLLTHILENGGSFNKVQLKYSATEGYSVFATHSLTQGEVAISVPYSLCLSLDSILKGPLSVILDSCPDILTYPDEVLAMALMCKAYSPDSVQAKHIASLPKSFNTPIFWSEEELNSLKGSMVWNLTNMMKKQIESDWNSIHAPLVKDFPDLLGGNTIEDYKWAISVVYSRALGITRDGVYIRVIPPIIDMANHNPDAATEAAETLCYSSLDDSLLFLSSKTRSAGEECHAYYGNYSNNKLLYTYGFVIPHLSRRTIDMWSSLSPTIPFAEVKQQILQSNDLTKNQTYDFEGTLRNGGWISPSLLATIRIIQATEDEFAVIGTGEATESGGVRSTYTGGVVSSRNELATYTSLRELLYAKLRPEAAQEERLKFAEYLVDDNLRTDDRAFMSLLIRVEERETIQECLDVVLEKLQSLQDQK